MLDQLSDQELEEITRELCAVERAILEFVAVADKLRRKLSAERERRSLVTLS